MKKTLFLLLLLPTMVQAQRVSDLPNGAALGPTDLFIDVQGYSGGTTGTTTRVSGAQLLAFAQGGILANAPLAINTGTLSLQITPTLTTSSGSLTLNLNNANTWTAAQIFNSATGTFNGIFAGALTGTATFATTAGNGGVTSFNTRTGAIALQAADVNAVNGGLTLPYSALTNAPASLPPNGAAAGDLFGSYPNPSIGNASHLTNFPVYNVMGLGSSSTNATSTFFGTNTAFSISATGTTTLPTLGPVNTSFLTVGAGSGAYTNSIVLATPGSQTNHNYFIGVSWPNSTNATLAFYDGSTGGANLINPTSNLNGGSSTFQFVWNNGWKHYSKGELPARNVSASAQTALGNTTIGSGSQLVVGVLDAYSDLVLGTAASSTSIVLNPQSNVQTPNILLPNGPSAGNVLFDGDSLTQGIGVPATGGNRNYAGALGAYPDYFSTTTIGLNLNPYNFGLSGDTLAQCISRFGSNTGTTTATTAGTSTVTVASNTGISIGMAVASATGDIPFGTTITGTSTGTLVLSNAATGTHTSENFYFCTANTFGYGGPSYSSAPYLLSNFITGQTTYVPLMIGTNDYFVSGLAYTGTAMTGSGTITGMTVMSGSPASNLSSSSGYNAWGVSPSGTISLGTVSSATSNSMVVSNPSAVTSSMTSFRAAPQITAWTGSYTNFVNTIVGYGDKVIVQTIVPFGNFDSFNSDGQTLLNCNRLLFNNYLTTTYASVNGVFPVANVTFADTADVPQFQYGPNYDYYRNGTSYPHFDAQGYQLWATFLSAQFALNYPSQGFVNPFTHNGIAYSWLPAGIPLTSVTNTFTAGQVISSSTGTVLTVNALSGTNNVVDFRSQFGDQYAYFQGGADGTIHASSSSLLLSSGANGGSPVNLALNGGSTPSGTISGSFGVNGTITAATGSFTSVSTSTITTNGLISYVNGTNTVTLNSGGGFFDSNNGASWPLIAYGSATGIVRCAISTQSTNQNATIEFTVLKNAGGTALFSFGADSAANGTLDGFIKDDGTGVLPIDIAPSTDDVTLIANLKLGTVGKTLSLKGGANAASGTVTLSSGAGSVASTAITANDVIVLTQNTPSGTAGTFEPLTRAFTGSFTVTGLGSDNSTYNWTAIHANQ